MLSMRQESAGLAINRRQIRLRSAYFRRPAVDGTTSDRRVAEPPFPPSRLFALRFHESDRLLDFSACMKSMTGVLVMPRLQPPRDDRATSLRLTPGR